MLQRTRTSVDKIPERDGKIPPTRAAQSALYNELAHYGLNSLELVGPKREQYDERLNKGVWLKSRLPALERNQESPSSTLPNLHAVRTLERAIPGSTRVLAESCGIRSFSRYPAEILLQQYRALRDGPILPGIIWAMPCTDHNGGCWMPTRVQELSYSAARAGLPTWFVEARSSGELAARVTAFGQGHALIVSGHGFGKDIELSDDRVPEASCDYQQCALICKAIGATTLVIDSCYSAKRASEVARRNRLTVIGSAGKASLTGIRVLGHPSAPRLMVSYVDGTVRALPNGTMRQHGTVRAPLCFVQSPDVRESVTPQSCVESG